MNFLTMQVIPNYMKQQFNPKQFVVHGRFPIWRGITYKN